MPRLLLENRNSHWHAESSVTQAVILRQFHVDPSTVARLRQRLHTIGRVSDRHQPFATPVASAAQHRHIRIQLLHNMFQRATAAAKRTNRIRQRQIIPAKSEDIWLH